MTDEQILKQSVNLKKEADEIVAKLSLLKIANKYCECHQIGSSVMDLMVDRDIDFVCYSNDEVDIDKCLKFAHELLKIPTVNKLKIKNYLDNPDYLQFKVYIDPYTFKGNEWQIAFSFEKKTENLVKSEIGLIDWVKSRITKESKLLILRLKLDSRQQGMKIPGAHIYKAVLEKGLNKLEDIV